MEKAEIYWVFEDDGVLREFDTHTEHKWQARQGKTAGHLHDDLV